MGEQEKLEITGERFIPESCDYELEMEHVERYRAVEKFVKGKVVLDAACGEGYGSDMLAQWAKAVTGVDIDGETVARAREKYKERDNLKYVEGSIADLQFIIDNSVDVVISFETIEHVDSDLQQKFIEEIYRILKKDGIVIMSSPNKKEYSDRYNFHNQFHVHELYIEEFAELLKTKFKNINLYQQYLEVASFIDRADKDESVILYHKERERYCPVGKYVIAVASNAELPEESLSMVSMHLQETFLPMTEEINQGKLWREETERRGIELEKRMAVINCNNEEIMRLENELKLANEELERRGIELENRMSVINKRDEEIMMLRNEKILSIIKRRIKALLTGG